MVDEERQDADEEQRRHEEQKQDVEFGVGVGELFCPEFDEILDDCGTNDYAVQRSVGQEQNEVFVVGESDTVIDPGAVMVHFQHTRLTGRAVMAAVGFDDLAVVAVSDRSSCSACIHR